MWMFRTIHRRPFINAATGDCGTDLNKDIAPILFQNCASCHHPGEVAPFSLLNYADVKKHSTEIAELTKNRQMPPWKPEHGFGEFLGERRLTDAQIDTIQQWVKAGRPEGNAGRSARAAQIRRGLDAGRAGPGGEDAQAYTLMQKGE